MKANRLVLAPPSPSDAELIAAVRGGDGHAYGKLFERHRDSALRLARQLTDSADADDLVSDAFIKVLRVLSAGGGPDLAFRAYLLTVVRRLQVDRVRRAARVRPSEQLESVDAGVPFTDPAVQEFENVAATKAFASLPERWQLVLWHVEVEGQKPAEVAPLLGLSPNSVSALAYRAREGLRQAYLQMHLADTADDSCRWTTERMGARVRNGLSRRDAATVDEHLDGCARCSAIYLELSEVNSNLAGILAPLLLGAAASGYLASAGSTVAGAGGWLLAVRSFATGHGPVTVASAAVGVVAVAVTIAAITSGDPRRDTATESTVSDLAAAAPSRDSSPVQPTDKSDPPSPSRTSPSSELRAAANANRPAAKTATIRTGSQTPGTQSATTTAGGLAPAPGTGPTNSPDTSAPTSSGPPTSSPPPTEPGADTLDLSLSMAVRAAPGDMYRGSIDVDIPPLANNVSVAVVATRTNSLTFSGAGWDCTPPYRGGVTSYTCRPSSTTPAALVVVVKFHPRAKDPHLSATVSAAGNDDPVPSNDTDYLLG